VKSFKFDENKRDLAANKKNFLLGTWLNNSWEKGEVKPIARKHSITFEKRALILRREL